MKHVKLLTLLCMYFFYAVSLKAAESEPNNDRASANVLSVNASNTGTIGVAGDVDWWSVATTGDGKLEATITISNGLNMWCQIYDNDGAILLSQGFTSGTTTVSKDGLAAGTYYIRVFAYYASELPTYTISNALAQPVQVNDVEPNGTKAQANVLPLNGSKTGHSNYYYNNQKDSADWYKVTTNGNGRLRLTMSSANGQNVWAYLYDNDGTTLLESGYTSGTAVVVNKDGLAAGTYYIRVKTFYTTEWAPYTLYDSLFKPTQANDNEVNDNKAQANVLPLNDSKTGHSNYYYNNQKDSADWYKVTTNGNGRLRLTMSSANGQNVWAYLYDNDGTTLLGSGFTSGTAVVVNKDGLAAGTYYIRVKTFYTTEWAPYTIYDSLFKPTQSNDTEVNDTKSQAKMFSLNGNTTGHTNYYYNLLKDGEDWYAITTNADGNLNISITSHNGQNVWAYLYDNNGSALLGSAYSSSSTNYNVDGLSEGTYYVRVKTFYSTEWAPYTLGNTLTPYTNTIDGEPNNAAYLGKTLPANAISTGHANFYYNLVKDSEDWHKINYTGSGTLTLNITQEAHKSNGGTDNLRIYVYKDTTSGPIASQYSTAASWSMNLSSLTQGYYWIKVNTFYSTEFASYTINPTFTQVNVANITITNAINGSCTTGQLQMQGNGSAPPYKVNLYRFGTLYNTYTSNDTIGFTASNLPPGKYYATAFGDGATGTAFGTSNNKNLLPPATTTTTETNITKTAATVKYVKSDCANGYVVQWRKQGTTPWSQKIVLGNKDSLRITGLLAGTTYQWRVAVGVGLDTLANYVLSTFSTIDQFTTAAAFSIANIGTQDQSALVTGGKMMVAPNPATHYFTIQCNGGLSGKINWSLTDINGRIVLSNTVDATQLSSTRIYINNIARGIYQLQLRGADGMIIATEKVIVQR